MPAGSLWAALLSFADTKAAVQERFQTVYARAEHVNLSPTNPQFRVIGNTGIVWGPYAAYFWARDAIRMFTTSGRMTMTFVKGEGKWLIVSQHLTGEFPGTDQMKVERSREESREIGPTDLRPQ